MRCNLSCPYCYADKSSAKTMDGEIQAALLRFTREHMRAYQVRKLHVTWVGGEATLAIDVMESLSERFRKLVDKQKECTYDAGLVTNGTLLTEENVKRLASPPVSIVTLQVTLDGTQPNHDKKRFDARGGTFERILEGAERALREKIRCDIRVNIDNLVSEEEVIELLRHLERRNLIGPPSGEERPRCSFHLAPIKATSPPCAGYSEFCQSPESFAQFYENIAAALPDLMVYSGFPPLKGTFCGLHNPNSYAIDPEGYVSKCWESLGAKERAIGHLQGNIDLGNRVLRDWLLVDPLVEDEECKACKLLPICMGGCMEVRLLGHDKRDVCAVERWGLTRRAAEAANVYLARTRRILPDRSLDEKAKEAC
jgi:uncharacterized protein